MIVPHRQLQPETLQSLVEEFVTRHGSVHGHQDVSFAQQVATVMRQLDTGKVVIVFDEENESCTLVTSDTQVLESNRLTD